MDDAVDRISGLPDELLHAILARLGSTRDAVRTGVLSRRWRHVWAPLPELVLGYFLGAPMPLPVFLDAVDGALAACEAPTLERLCIGPCGDHGHGVPNGRVEPWLRFASERVVGTLLLLVPQPAVSGEEAVLHLPACEGVATIDLSFEGDWRIRPPSAGLFRALTDLRILSGRMEGSELTALVCMQCPCLMDLRLDVMLVDASDVSIRSDSLHSLWFSVKKTRRLEIVALRLEKLSVSVSVNEARISAPKLAEVVWPYTTYDPHRHRFDDVGRRLRLLELGLNVSLMHQFDEVDELKLGIFIPQGIAGYQSFLNETNKLPKCKILSITSVGKHHGLVPGMLHLLRSCDSTMKISLIYCCDNELSDPCLPSCPCRLEQSHRIDDIALNSLEEVEITSDTTYHEVLEFVVQLSRCDASMLKKVVLKYKMNSGPPPTKEVCEEIRSMCPPNTEVEFYVFSDWNWVLCTD